MENVLKIVEVVEELIKIQEFVMNVQQVIVIHVLLTRKFVKIAKKVIYFIIIFVMIDVHKELSFLKIKDIVKIVMKNLLNVKIRKHVLDVKFHMFYKEKNVKLNVKMDIMTVKEFVMNVKIQIVRNVLLKIVQNVQNVQQVHSSIKEIV
jgi:hypothetical protein